MPISKVQLPDNTTQDINDARISDISSTYPKFYVGTCPTAAATAAKVVTTETFPTVNGVPVTGTVIAVKFTYTNSATAPTLNVNGLGAASIYYNTAVVTSTSATYGGTASRYTYYMWDGTNWCWLNHGVDNDTNTTAYLVRYQYASKPLAGHLARYRLLFTSADGTKWVPSNTETSTNATSSKTVNQTPIDPFGPIVYYGSTTIKEADEIVAASALYIQQSITFGYSFNVTNAALTLTVNTPVYIKCAPQSNGSAIIDSTTPYVQSLPSTADGKIYIYLGQAYSATTVELSIAHPVYYYADGQIRLWTNAASGGGNEPLIVEVTGVYDSTYQEYVPTISSGTYAGIKAALIAGRQVLLKYTADNNIGYAYYSSFDDVTSDYSSPFKFRLHPNNETVWTFSWYRTDQLLLNWVGTGLSISVNGTDVGYYNPEVYEDSSDQEYRAIDITVPTKTSDLTNDSGFITNAGVTSFNGSTGAVTIAVPTATSDLTNDSGFQSLAYTAISSASSSTTLAWNTVYQWTVNPTSISLTLPSAPTDSRGEIVLKFTTGSTAPTVTWPSGLKWANGEEITPEASTTYEFSIGYDMMGGWTILGCGFTSAS